ncbi:hypothetical protein GOD03_12305 [Sinorhizobium medicae]|nr:hypothetical protein [Sinorhizobium medicae]
MKTGVKLGGAAVAACAVCCAAPAIPALVAGTSVLALGAAATYWSVAALAVAVPAATMLYFFRHRIFPSTAASAAVAESGCGCSPAYDAGFKKDAPIACALDTQDFRARSALIEEITDRHLTSSIRRGNTLSLSYAPEAFDEISDLVGKERECCAFLSFNLKRDAGGVHLTIVAPESAAADAALLFQHFEPKAQSKKPETV